MPNIEKGETQGGAYNKVLETLRIVKLQAQWIRLAKMYICGLEFELNNKQRKERV